MKLCNDCPHLGKEKKSHSYICLHPKSKLFKVPFSHGKTRKACSLLVSRSRPSGSGSIAGMKFIEDFRGKYPGSTFWIVGCDPNLDFYPDDFFDDKLNIAISASCIAFPDSTYFLFIRNPNAATIKNARPDFLAKFILLLDHRKLEPQRQLKSLYWGDYGLDPIYMKPMGVCQNSITEMHWRKMVGQIFGDGPIEFAWPHSSSHLGIEVAAILGATKIVLVGCSHKSTKWHVHARKRGMWVFCPDKFQSQPFTDPESGYPSDWRLGEARLFSDMKHDTLLLKKLFGEHGIEIVRHRFDEEKNKFIFEEIPDTDPSSKSGQLFRFQT